MIRLAFTGNPNVGKSALINAIAGSKLKVGNWPGVIPFSLNILW